MSKNARRAPSIKIAIATGLLLLVAAAPASAASVFADGFESGTFSAWSVVQTGGDGKAVIQSATVRTGTVAAQLSESATAGSRAYLRKTFTAAQQDLTASGDFQVVTEGASGGNVPFFRFLDPASARVVSVFRQNATGAIGLTFADGTRGSSTGKLALGTWAKIGLHVITAGTASTVEVSLNGTQVYRSTTQSLGNAGVSTIQVGNDTTAQAFNVVADTIDVQNAAPATPSPPVNTVRPTISGAAQQGQTLTAGSGTWVGAQPITVTRQWQSCDSAGAACTGIANQAGATYVVTATDVGRTIRVAETATNTAGTASSTSNQTAVVVAPSTAPVNSSPPTITGTPQGGQTLTASPGSWTGSQPIAFSYKWQRCNATGTGCADITPPATSATYTVTSADVNNTLHVIVTASNSGGSATATSNATGVVSAAPANPPGLVALWHMNETSGSVMQDSARTHNGTLSNVVLAQPGFAGTAYGFTGSSQVLVPDAADLNAGAAALTVTIHLKATKVPATPDWDLIRKGVFASAGGEFKVEYQPSGQATCGFNTSTNYAELTAGPALNNGQWHTVQCVKTSTNIKLVVDGQTFTQAASLGTIANNVQVAVGAHPGAEFFQGSLDEASIQIG